MILLDKPPIVISLSTRGRWRDGRFYWEIFAQGKKGEWGFSERWQFWFYPLGSWIAIPALPWPEIDFPEDEFTVLEGVATDGSGATSTSAGGSEQAQ